MFLQVANGIISIPTVKDENYRSKRITISNVKHYAYGQHQDGEVGIWVAGQAGWFLIAPAKGYKAVYKEMVEAIDLLYFLADQYHGKDLKRKKRKRSPNLNRLYQEVRPTKYPNLCDWKHLTRWNSMSTTRTGAVQIQRMQPTYS